jgi:uncharacterized membrane protein YuzA (DUF378 family)
MNTTTLIALVLVIVGGLNWLLVGLFEFDLVAALFDGQTALLSRIVYVLVGLSALWLLVRLPIMINRRPDVIVTTPTASSVPPRDPSV